jgi:hypothetical protein
MLPYVSLLLKISAISYVAFYFCKKSNVCPIHPDKELRQNMSECQIDKMIEDSFPASDPPSTY